MSAGLKARLKQLKFISSMFSMAMDEFNNVMGPETIQTIFRLIGERQGEAVEKRVKEKNNVDKWTPELFQEISKCVFFNFKPSKILPYIISNSVLTRAFPSRQSNNNRF